MKEERSVHNLAISLYRNRQPEKALEVIVPLLHEQTGNGTLLNLAGACCYSMGKKLEAAAYWERATFIQPEAVEPHCNLGTVLCELGQLARGEKLLRHAFAIAPESAEVSSNLGNVLRQRGMLSDAEEVYRRGLASHPNYATLHNNLGAVLRALKRPAESEIAYRNALTAEPRFTEAYNDLALLLQKLGRFAEADEAFRRALEIDTGFVLGYSNHARLLYEMRRYEEAAIAAARAIELNPNNADAQLILGEALATQNAGDIQPSINAYRRAVEINPDSIIAHSNLAYSLLFKSDDGYEILRECRRFAAQFEAPYLAQDVDYANDRVEGRRLRIGYVSPDFCNHCQSLYMMPLLRNHDHVSLEIYCYSSVRITDKVTAQLSKYADIWRDVSMSSDESVAKIIKDDQIDILVDLTMHMSGGRPLLFARRPAPVQVAWLAYPGTTGSRAITYRLTDPWLAPPESSKADDRYSERSIRLPDTFWCYDPLVTPFPVSGLAADENGFVTFGCLNSPRKLTDRTLQLWAAILKSVVDSKMILLLAQGSAREQVRSIFEAMGVDPSRLIFRDYQPRKAYLLTFEKIDITLDTFPYNGHTTSLDSFWMGVPVVTIVGSSPVSRAGYALLQNLGLPELSASTDEEFVRIAVRLARDRSRLRTLRCSLRERMEQSPLMDGPRFARGVEQAYLRMWKEWCQSGRSVEQIQ
ncbi:tetratricopeptide repeat protein [Paraburkholderia sp. J41]|uniref:O-linked N-acetylglucosamine transferase, SPINDLY family protein n=1 Tax=Paraburkholderia sp. J41 TaxID=2805433 RepID=UPI002AC37026|nr:tetratricopeptide repeat protein [Paraburkholderia sp. J41]